MYVPLDERVVFEVTLDVVGVFLDLDQEESAPDGCRNTEMPYETRSLEPLLGGIPQEHDQ